MPMRKQQAIWLKEHGSQAMLPALAEQKPASGVVKFIDFLKSQSVDIKGRAIDIGCGRGRNTVYLAELGLDVFAVDYIQPALDSAQKLAESKGVAEKVHLIHAAIDEPWDFPNDYFDFAIDCFSSIDIETKEGRQTYKNELLRTLKHGGYALVRVVSADDEWEIEAAKNATGSEPNSVIWKENGKFQKNYDEQELGDFYKDFMVLRIEKISKPATKAGRKGTATDFWMVIQKKS